MTESERDRDLDLRRKGARSRRFRGGGGRRLRWCCRLSFLPSTRQKSGVQSDNRRANLPRVRSVGAQPRSRSGSRCFAQSNSSSSRERERIGRREGKVGTPTLFRTPPLRFPISLFLSAAATPRRQWRPPPQKSKP
ncbi:hypothetical protein NL676_007475 [Syzygium grande]|nr:hypothetical protein NL676_007475 [Syzygium grande]